MATESRHEDPALAQDELKDSKLAADLRADPSAFDFFQAVRLLEQFLPDRQPVGRFSNPDDEVIRIGAAPEIGFPPGQISRLDWGEGAPPAMRVNFMGLTGPLGILPLYYSTLVRERLRAKDTSLRDFLDIFNHRMISLFYQAWEKHHFAAGHGRGSGDRLSPHLSDLLGIGTPGLAGRLSVPEEALLFRSGLLLGQSRSASGLKALLTDYFGVPVEIEEFVGQWHPIEPSTQCSFMETGSDSECLGFGAVVGDEMWDPQSGVRIRLGPMSLAEYREFLPQGSAHQPLRDLVRFYAGNELDFEVCLVLRKEEARPCQLGEEGAAAPRLGWSTWSGTAPLARDPDEAVLRI